MNNDQLYAMYHSVNETLGLLREEVRRRNIDWRHLVANGLRVEAIKAYRDKEKCTLMEAKDAVDSFANSIK